MKSTNQKPTFIKITHEGHATFINSQDLRVITVTDGKVTIRTSVWQSVFPCSDHMARRVKEELGRRYHAVLVTPQKTTVERRHGARHALLTLADGHVSATIFPRALKTLTVSGNLVTAHVSAKASGPGGSAQVKLTLAEPLLPMTLEEVKSVLSGVPV